ncbi:MAG: hypothetical protein PHG02_04020 [Oscillospiraceae bacterium]|nr:hypothetical protein [Oscillospiraceae bacterium]
MTKNIGVISSPNLPQGLVSTVVVSPQNTAVLDALRQRDIEVLCTQPAKMVSTPVNIHADMLCLYLGDNQIVVEESQLILKKLLQAYNLSVKQFKLKSGGYPFEAALNVGLIGKFCFQNFKVLNRPCELNKFQLVQIKQGYTKCNMAIVNEQAIITQDIGIAVAAKKQGIDVLLIEEQEIKLAPYNYGFIGGCCGLIAPDKLAFTGNIMCHKSGKLIYNFLKKYCVEPIALQDGQLEDIGGILPIIEKT